MYSCLRTKQMAHTKICSYFEVRLFNLTHLYCFYLQIKLCTSINDYEDIFILFTAITIEFHYVLMI